jgi:AraC-like DNA-binding protein
MDSARPARPPVLPDACIDLVWDGADLLVAGPDTAAVPIGDEGTFTGIRFRPGSAPGFLGVSASELLDRRVPLSDLWGPTAEELAERLADAALVSAPGVLERALLERQQSAAPPDRLIDQVLHQLGRARPRDDVQAGLARATGVSERTLRRRCAAALGYGPKTLERILRFRRALRLLRTGHSVADGAALAGYADQAHLTNECRRLARTTPAALARARRLDLPANGCD